MAVSILYSASFLAIAFILNLIISKIRYNRKYKFPNVVPGYPIIGSTLDIPYPAGMWAAEKTKKYGEM